MISQNLDAVVLSHAFRVKFVSPVTLGALVGGACGPKGCMVEDDHARQPRVFGLGHTRIQPGQCTILCSIVHCLSIRQWVCLVLERVLGSFIVQVPIAPWDLQCDNGHATLLNIHIERTLGTLRLHRQAASEVCCHVSKVLGDQPGACIFCLRKVLRSRVVAKAIHSLVIANRVQGRSAGILEHIQWRRQGRRVACHARTKQVTCVHHQVALRSHVIHSGQPLFHTAVWAAACHADRALRHD
mmetsp:Transcript_48676/g.89769  ORF Transcript_48676/g.89769 Transcript_48676/m.89769 type:complete len:242 (+) Transcript_48676:447-1172(+)